MSLIIKDEDIEMRDIKEDIVMKEKKYNYTNKNYEMSEEEFNKNTELVNRFNEFNNVIEDYKEDPLYKILYKKRKYN